MDVINTQSSWNQLLEKGPSSFHEPSRLSIVYRRVVAHQGRVRLGASQFVEIPDQSLRGIGFWKRDFPHFADGLDFQYTCPVELAIPDEGQQETSQVRGRDPQGTGWKIKVSVVSQWLEGAGLFLEAVGHGDPGLVHSLQSKRTSVHAEWLEDAFLAERLERGLGLGLAK